MLIENPMDDEIIAKVIATVGEMQNGVTTRSTIKSSNIIVSGKKIKITQQIIEAAYQKLRVVIKDKKVDAGSVVIIAAYALQIANEMIITSKTYKVELALAIIRKLIDAEVEDPDQKVMLYMLVESTVPSLIDTIQGLPNFLSKLFAKCCCSSKKINVKL